jgi:GNAT superfamily N-acetyltransferase
VTKSFSVSAANPDELPTVVAILDDAARWLHERGIEQWPESFSGDATWRTDRIRSYIEHGLTYLARDESGQPIATFTLSRAADPQFAHGWPGGPEDAGYIFRMAVLREAAGRGVGGQLLDWAADAVGKWGFSWLRLDVHRFNPELQAYYSRRGFEKVGEVTAPDLTIPGRIRGSGTLMQRATAKGNGVEAKGNYDPDGSAAIWLEAANYVRGMMLEQPPVSPAAWNDALTQASRALERHAIEIRQSSGMYYRAMDEQSGS